MQALLLMILFIDGWLIIGLDLANIDIQIWKEINETLKKNNHILQTYLE